jgi:hypothetical protein
MDELVVVSDGSVRKRVVKPGTGGRGLPPHGASVHGTIMPLRSQMLASNSSAVLTPAPPVQWTLLGDLSVQGTARKRRTRCLTPRTSVDASSPLPSAKVLVTHGRHN